MTKRLSPEEKLARKMLKKFVPPGLPPPEPRSVVNGRKCGKARARNLSKRQLSAIGRLGARARWGKRGARERVQAA